MTLCSNEHNAVEKYYEVFFRRHIALHLLNRNEDSGWIDADMPTCRNAGSRSNTGQHPAAGFRILRETLLTMVPPPFIQCFAARSTIF